MIQTYFRLREDLLYDGEGGLQIETEHYTVVRRTPKGAWIRRAHPYGGRERFVLDGDGKRFAYPTMEAAIASYKIRKECHVQHLESQLLIARAALATVNMEGFVPDKTYQHESLLAFHEY